MKDNRGFTLIELIVIMVIMGIVAIGSMVGYHLLSSGGTRSSVDRISSMLDYVQLENMTKSKTYYLVIEQKTDGKYYIAVEEENTPANIRTLEEELDLKKGEITFQYSDDASKHLIRYEPAGSESLRLCFYKDTGGFKPIAGNTVSKIGVSASRRAYSIRLVELTGKHYIE